MFFYILVGAIIFMSLYFGIQAVEEYRQQRGTQKYDVKKMFNEFIMNFGLTAFLGALLGLVVFAFGLLFVHTNDGEFTPSSNISYRLAPNTNPVVNNNKLEFQYVDANNNLQTVKVDYVDKFTFESTNKQIIQIEVGRKTIPGFAPFSITDDTYVTVK